MINSINFPKGITAEIFVRDYWQKKALFIKNAFPDFTNPLTPEELAGLACEEGIASRLICEHGEKPWQVTHGPLNEENFTQLEKSHYTFLVQDLNRYIPELNLLLDSFNFLPSWRIDDVMASYAAPYGSVGPHTDQYDVFLIQGLGARTWQINSTENNLDEKLIPDLELRILAEFSAEEKFIMQPGDMLYLPPGVQHHGLGEEPNMTYSVGFRAATQLELLGDYIDQRTLTSCNDVRFRDGEIEADTHNGEIKLLARQRIREMIREIPSSDEDIDEWFGKFITYTGIPMENGIPLSTDSEPTEFIENFSSKKTLLRDTQSRFAYIETPQGLQLYINNESIFIDKMQSEQIKMIRLLCDQRQYDHDNMSEYLNNPATLSLINSWWENNLVYFNA